MKPHLDSPDSESASRKAETSDHPSLPVRIYRAEGGDLRRMPTAFDDCDPMTAVKALLLSNLAFEAVHDGDAIVVMTTGLEAHELPEVCLAVQSRDFSEAEAATMLGYAICTFDDLHAGDKIVLDVADRRSVTMFVTSAPTGSLLIVQDLSVPVLAPVSTSIN